MEEVLHQHSTPNQSCTVSELSAWLAWRHMPGMTPKRFHQLLALSQRLHLSLEQLLDNHLEVPEITHLTDKQPPRWAAVEQDLRWLQQAPQHHILTYDDPAYPPLLRQTVWAPPLLFVCGNPLLLSSPQIAMVGSRKATPSGLATARTFASQLAQQGLIITSGLALGIDAASHGGALDCGGITIAVMGTGPDRIYPTRHQALAERIAAQGALVTEFVPGTPPHASHFPSRNRIISGLSLGVLVVEAALQSGSLITARVAAEQNREVFAVPGAIQNPFVRGCHSLIRDGAKLVENATDILEELPFTPITQGEIATLISTHPQSPLSPSHQKLLDCVDFAPTALETLINRSGLAVSTISSLLLSLELAGHVVSVPGGYTRAMRTSS